MSAITITNHGSFKFTDKFLRRVSERWFIKRLTRYGEMGVEALMNATPIDTGKTAASWGFEIVKETAFTLSFGRIVTSQKEIQVRLSWFCYTMVM